MPARHPRCRRARRCREPAIRNQRIAAPFRPRAPSIAPSPPHPKPSAWCAPGLRDFERAARPERARSRRTSTPWPRSRAISSVRSRGKPWVSYRRKASSPEIVAEVPGLALRRDLVEERHPSFDRGEEPLLLGARGLEQVVTSFVELRISASHPRHYGIDHMDQSWPPDDPTTRRAVRLGAGCGAARSPGPR